MTRTVITFSVPNEKGQQTDIRTILTNDPNHGVGGLAETVAREIGRHHLHVYSKYYPPAELGFNHLGPVHYLFKRQNGRSDCVAKLINADQPTSNKGMTVWELFHHLYRPNKQWYDTTLRMTVPRPMIDHWKNSEIGHLFKATLEREPKRQINHPVVLQQLRADLINHVCFSFNKEIFDYPDGKLTGLLLNTIGSEGVEGMTSIMGAVFQTTTHPNTKKRYAFDEVDPYEVQYVLKKVLNILITRYFFPVGKTDEEELLGYSLTRRQRVSMHDLVEPSQENSVLVLSTDDSRYDARFFCQFFNDDDPLTVWGRQNQVSVDKYHDKGGSYRNISAVSFFVKAPAQVVSEALEKALSEPVLK